MKSLKYQFILLAILAISFASCNNKNAAIPANEDGWITMDNVEKAVKNEKKNIIVDVYTKWCGPCKMMDRKTFKDPEMKKMFDNFHIVKFDAEGADEITFQGKLYANPAHNPKKRGRNSQHELSRFFGVRGYPTLVVLDPDFKIIDKLVGYKTPEQLIPLLEKYK